MFDVDNELITWISLFLWHTGSDPVVMEKTLLELELKGTCDPYNVVIEPSVMLIPGRILQDTVIRRKFKVARYCDFDVHVQSLKFTQSYGK